MLFLRAVGLLLSVLLLSSDTTATSHAYFLVKITGNYTHTASVSWLRILVITHTIVNVCLQYLIYLSSYAIYVLLQLLQSIYSTAK